MRDGSPRLTASLLLPRQVVIQAHQEQLDEMAELGFKEETLDEPAGSLLSGGLGWSLQAVGT